MRQEYCNVVLRAEHDRNKYDDRSCRAGDYRHADFLDTFNSRFKWLIRVHFSLSKDVLRNDDRVVDQHADCKHEPHHRQNVQTEVEEKHHSQGDEQ